MSVSVNTGYGTSGLSEAAVDATVNSLGITLPGGSTGNCLVVLTTYTSGDGYKLNSVSGGGCTNWQEVGSVPSSPGYAQAIFIGTVQSTGAQTLSFSWSGAITGSFAVGTLLLSGYSEWHTEDRFSQVSSSGTTVTCAALAATGTGAEVYICQSQGAGQQAGTTDPTSQSLSNPWITGAAAWNYAIAWELNVTGTKQGSWSTSSATEWTCAGMFYGGSAGSPSPHVDITIGA